MRRRYEVTFRCPPFAEKPRFKSFKVLIKGEDAGDMDAARKAEKLLRKEVGDAGMTDWMLEDVELLSIEGPEHERALAAEVEHLRRRAERKAQQS